MSAFNYEQKVSYYAVPKCACTSLKHYFFELENGFRFSKFRVNGTVKQIHGVMPTLIFEKNLAMDRDDHARFSVVRDPVDRLLSCYSNRVVYYRELSERHLSQEAIQAGLVPNPSLSEFIRMLETYRKYSASIYHHSNPIVMFLGGDINHYTRVYSMSDLREFIEHMTDLSGKKIDLRHEQSGGEKIKRSELSRAEIRKIEMIYKRDYDAFGSLL